MLVSRINVENVEFGDRQSRTIYLAKRFRQYLHGKVLDVGCYEAPLRNLLQNTEYVGIDFVGNPDIHINLEKCQKLPFEANSFRCVICIDVLEHLDNLHAMFDELIRVSGQYIVISLPNCWRDARRPVTRGKGAIGHYGLDVTPPNDRHKWFFSFTQAQTFAIGQAERHGLTVRELFGTENRRVLPLQWCRKMRYPGGRYLNRYVQTLWAVYEKN